MARLAHDECDALAARKPRDSAVADADGSTPRFRLHFWAPRCALLSDLRPVCSDAPAGHSEQVIHEVDVALRSLIEREATDGTEVEVVFDAPTKDWAGRRNVPTIDVYLYDIREDLRRRERGLINEYDDRDRISG